MKKSDIAMIILIATVSIMVSFFVTRAVMGDPASETQKAPTIEKITADIDQPDPRIFNSEAINPAVEVQITPKEQ